MHPSLFSLSLLLPIPALTSFPLCVSFLLPFPSHCCSFPLSSPFLNLPVLLFILLFPLLLCLSLISHSLFPVSLSLSLQVLRIMVVFLRLVVLTSARAQMAWCDAATEGCTLCPRAFPRTPQSCESHVNTHTYTHTNSNTRMYTYLLHYSCTRFCSNIETHESQ